MPDRFFHTILPIPECDRSHPKTQMRLNGNLSLHVLGYECPHCFYRITVSATFKEDFHPKPTAETIAATDMEE